MLAYVQNNIIQAVIMFVHLICTDNLYVFNLIYSYIIQSNRVDKLSSHFKLPYTLLDRSLYAVRKPIWHMVTCFCQFVERWRHGLSYLFHIYVVQKALALVDNCKFIGCWIHEWPYCTIYYLVRIPLAAFFNAFFILYRLLGPNYIIPTFQSAYVKKIKTSFSLIGALS